jgi:ABC-type transport system involved in multi-copper enzyme maturation permease subunit
MRAATTIARYTLLEARRSGLPWLALGCIAAALALAAFVSQVAITEGLRLQLAIAGALLRAGAVFLLVAHVVASITREANDKGIELALALPLSRPAWYLGKLLGFSACGAILALAFVLPLSLWAGPAELVAWGVSLALECALVAAAALFFASALTQVVPAIAGTAGLYLLARAVTAIQAIASGPLAEQTIAGRIARGSVDAVAYLLPQLDMVTRTDWLVYGAPPALPYLQAIAGMTLYFALLAAAGLFDFSRRNL